MACAIVASDLRRAEAEAMVCELRLAYRTAEVSFALQSGCTDTNYRYQLQVAAPKETCVEMRGYVRGLQARTQYRDALQTWREACAE